MADNINHNLRTIDGTGTFHGMGTITLGLTQRQVIPRKIITADDVHSAGKIQIHSCRDASRGFANLI